MASAARLVLLLLCAAVFTVAGDVAEFVPVSLGLRKQRREAPRREAQQPQQPQQPQQVAESGLGGLSLLSTAAGGELQGAIWADYSVEVTIGSQSFQVIVDTGSSNFAVAASPQAGCSLHYSGQCTGETAQVSYGSGKWNGYVCQGPEVTMAGLSAGTPAFDGIYEQENFLTSCADDMSWMASQGIVGMGYQTLMDGSEVPLFDAVVSTTGIPNIFSMQCCGWNGGSAPASGMLTLGGINSALYTGQLQWTNITRELYYCVSMTQFVASPLPATTSTSRSSHGHRYGPDHQRHGRPALRGSDNSMTNSTSPTVEVELEVARCQRETGTSCFLFGCDQELLGPSSCSWGSCSCQPGHCAVAGVCVNETEVLQQAANLTLGAAAVVPTTAPLASVDAASTIDTGAGFKKLAAAASTGQCRTIIDSGTSSIILREELYAPVMAALNEAAAALQTDCITQQQLSVFPDLLMSFAGGVELTVPPKRYLQPAPRSDCLQLFIEQGQSNLPNIIGQAMMEEYYTVFDRANKRIGFAPIAGC